MEAGRGRATKSEAGEMEEEKEELLGQHKTDCLFLLQSGAHSSHALWGSMDWMASGCLGERERGGVNENECTGKQRPTLMNEKG